MRLKRGDEKTLGKYIRAILREEPIGTGFGALAAGADILIAEALLEAGVELHVVLPSPASAFRVNSVSRYGQRWAPASMRCCTRQRATGPWFRDSGTPLPLAIRLAAEVAMGRAAREAETLQTEAVQLVVLANGASIYRDPSASAWMASLWRCSRRRKHVLRVGGMGGSHASTSLRKTHACSAAMLCIDFPDAAPAANFEIVAAPRQLPILERPALAPRWTGTCLLIRYRSPREAVDTITAVIRRPDMEGAARIAGHYGIPERLMAPFSRTSYLGGCAAKVPGEIALSTPIGAFPRQ